jgi:cell division protein FtsL
MAKDNRILFYTDGSAARQLEPELPQKQPSRLPKRRKRKQPVLYYDPVALCSLVVTVVMLVLLVSGVMQLYQAGTEANRLEQHVAQLRRENDALRKEYESGFDLDAIREEALAMGMIPKEQAQTITIQVELPEPAPEDPSFLEQVWTFLTTLFA